MNCLTLSNRLILTALAFGVMSFVPLRSAESLELCVGAFMEKRTAKYEAFVTTGTCGARDGGWHGGYVVTLLAVNRRSENAFHSKTSRQYVNFNLGCRGSLCRKRFGNINTCARATAVGDNGHKLTSAIRCGRRSFK